MKITRKQIYYTPVAIKRLFLISFHVSLENKMKANDYRN